MPPLGPPIALASPMSLLLQDLRHGARVLGKNPGVSALAIAVIALGIGANSAIFSVINAVLLNSLPYEESDRLVLLWTDASSSGGPTQVRATPADIFDWREQTRAFEAITYFQNQSLTLTALDQPVTPLVHGVDAAYFEVLGVPTALGRTFAVGEDSPGRDGVVVMSHRLWRDAFGSDPSVIGRQVELDGQPLEVIGVLPEGFHSLSSVSVQPDLWRPLVLAPFRNIRTGPTISVIGRLAPAATLDQAEADFRLVVDRIAAEHPDTNGGRTGWLQPVRDFLVGNLEQPLAILFGAVGFVMLLVCANVANLLLARSACRAKEMALRLALGAGRGRLVRQLLTESILLAGVGALFGLLLANWGVQPLLALIPDSAGVPFLDQASPDARVVGFTSVLALLTGLLFGLAPARQGSKAPLAQVLQEAGRSNSSGRTAGRVRETLVVSETAVSLVLLVAAVLMMQSLYRLTELKAGYEAGGVLSVRNALRGPDYATPESRSNHFSEAIRKLNNLPGVEQASAISFPPPMNQFGSARISLPGVSATPGQEPRTVTRVVTPGFFETLRIPLLQGRTFTESDGSDAPMAAVVTESFVRAYFDGQDPLGRSFDFVDRFSGRWQIIGVVGDLRFSGAQPETRPVVFMPHTQQPFQIMSFMVRTSVDPISLSVAIQKEIWSLGRLMNVYQAEPLAQRLPESYWEMRFTMMILGLFAAIALVLGAAGLYGVISSVVSQRTREIGVRMALGADRGKILTLVLRQGLGLAGLGVLLGAAGSLALNRLLSSMLFGVEPNDPLTLIAVAAILLTVAGSACAVPALRAARTQPVTALRYE